MSKILSLIDYALAGDSYNGHGKNDGLVGTLFECVGKVSLYPLSVYIKLVKERSRELYRVG